MTTNDVLHRLTPLIGARTAHLPADPVDLVPATRLEQDLRMDSLAIVHVLEDIEESFDVTITDEQLARVYTVGDLVDIVRATAGSEGRAA